MKPFRYMRLSELLSFQAERRVAKVNIFSDGKKDEEYVTQYCCGLEDPRYEYDEGCDSIDRKMLLSNRGEME